MKSRSKLGITADYTVLASGFSDGLNDTIKLSNSEMNRALEDLDSIIEEKRKVVTRKQGLATIASNQHFLEKNKLKKGIVTTNSGLQYEVLILGTGERPEAEDTVEVHYVGTLTDGTEFDSSVARGAPATFPLNRVIPGWTEAVQLMPVGSKYKLFIPSRLAYGERKTGTIPANSVLIFEVELLSITR